MIKIIKYLGKRSVLTISFLTLAILSSCSEEIENEEQVIVEPIPIAAFSSMVDIDDWKTYSFENLSSNASSYAWDFGDGNSATTDAPSNTYSGSGAYKVKLTAKDNFGETDVVERTVVVTNPNEAVAGFSFEVDASDWKTIKFSNTSTNATSYAWDFGDGTGTSTEENPVYTYAGQGDYTVKLTATGDTGDPNAFEQAIEVKDPNAAITPTFKAIVLNGACNDWTNNTSDNADAWDMSPNSTLVDNSGTTIDSPYRALWYNSDLDAWLGSNCGDSSELPGSSGDGNKFGANAGGGRGVKLNEACRRLYQVVTVEIGVEYTFTIDSRSEAAGVNSEVFILNNEITTEEAINSEAARDTNADAYYLIDNDFNSSKSSSSNDTFTTNTFTFIPTTNKIVIYVRASNAVDSSNEVFYDNIDIITPGF